MHDTSSLRDPGGAAPELVGADALRALRFPLLSPALLAVLCLDSTHDERRRTSDFRLPLLCRELFLRSSPIMCGSLAVGTRLGGGALPRASRVVAGGAGTSLRGGGAGTSCVAAGSAGASAAPGASAARDATSCWCEHEGREGFRVRAVRGDTRSASAFA